MKQDGTKQIIGKKIRKTVLLVFAVVLFIFQGNTIITAAENNQEKLALVSITTLENGLTREVYIVSNNSRAASRGYTTYVQYKDKAGVLITEIKVVVAFSYDNTDGIARISSANYQLVRTQVGYAVQCTRKSTANGNPAIAKYSFAIYHNTGSFSDSFEVWCYNNGSAKLN